MLRLSEAPSIETTVPHGRGNSLADTDYYLTVSMKNDTDLHDVEVSKRQYHSLGKGSKVKCIVTYRNGKVDDIELDED